MEERERGIYTESSRGAEVGFVNGIVMRDNIGAVNTSCLDRCREGDSFFSSLFSFQNLCVTMCLNSQKDCARPWVGDERKSSEMRVGD